MTLIDSIWRFLMADHARLTKYEPPNLGPTLLLDSEEAAATMKIHPKTLQKLARRGAVPGIRVGKLWRFRSSDIQEWIDRQ